MFTTFKAKAHRAEADGAAVWKTERSEFRRAHGVTEDWKPWTGQVSFKGTGLPDLPRVMDMIDSFVIKCMVAKGLRVRGNHCECDLQQLMSGKYVDVSQSLSRNAHTHLQSGINHAMTTGSLLYSYDRDSVLTGREMLQLHGQPKTLVLPDQLSEAQLVQLAGEGIALPSLAAVLWCLYLTKQFPV